MSSSWKPSDPPHPKLSKLGKEIYSALAESPNGLDVFQIKQKVTLPKDQQQFDRRIRQLRKYYQVDGKHKGRRYIYVIKGYAKKAAGDEGRISAKLRAEILHSAKGQCQMCGKTIRKDKIKLQIDHKIPQAWGGKTTIENLWAICDRCNGGKKDYFASFNDVEIKKIIRLPSVHERVAHTLKINQGRPVSSKLLEFVANATERQEDWHKRLRELRYPPIGLKITVGKQKNPQGYIESTYTLHNWKDIPPDHKRLIRDWDNRKKNSKPQK